MVTGADQGTFGDHQSAIHVFAHANITLDDLLGVRREGERTDRKKDSDVYGL